jgi:hypothetical protein
VRGPQYEVQHRIMEQEGGNTGYSLPTPGSKSHGPPMMRPSSAPPMQPYQNQDPRGDPYHHGPPGPRNQGPYPPMHHGPHPNNHPPHPGPYGHNPPGLPPGAMPPPSGSDQWLGNASSGSGSPYAIASGGGMGPPGPGGPNRSRSPPSKGIPPPHENPGGPPPGSRQPTRSMSANVGGPPRPQMQRGLLPPNMNGSWGPPPGAGPGPHPQPPPQMIPGQNPAAANRARTNSLGDASRGGGYDGDDTPLAWQQNGRQDMNWGRVNRAGGPMAR